MFHSLIGPTWNPAPNKQARACLPLLPWGLSEITVLYLICCLCFDQSIFFSFLYFMLPHLLGPIGYKAPTQSGHREATANRIPRAAVSAFCSSAALLSGTRRAGSLRTACVSGSRKPRVAQPTQGLALRNKHAPGKKLSPSTQKCLISSRTWPGPPKYALAQPYESS